MTKDFYEQVNTILHRVMNVVDNIDRDRRESNTKWKKEIQTLLLARQELLGLVELKAKENGNGKTKKR